MIYDEINKSHKPTAWSPGVCLTEEAKDTQIHSGKKNDFRNPEILRPNGLVLKDIRHQRGLT